MKQNNEDFIQACTDGDLKELKKAIKKGADIYYNNSEGFIFACMEGHIKIVDYLLTSKDLKTHVDINVRNNSAFSYACEHNHIELIKYLLTSKKLKKHADMHANDDEGFRYLCLRKNSPEIQEILKYLILDMNYEKTKPIEIHLFEVPNEYVSKLFDLRQLNKKLTQNLKQKTKVVKKNKL